MGLGFGGASASFSEIAGVSGVGLLEEVPLEAGSGDGVAGLGTLRVGLEGAAAVAARCLACGTAGLAGAPTVIVVADRDFAMGDVGEKICPVDRPLRERRFERLDKEPLRFSGTQITDTNDNKIKVRATRHQNNK